MLSEDSDFKIGEKNQSKVILLKEFLLQSQRITAFIILDRNYISLKNLILILTFIS